MKVVIIGSGNVATIFAKKISQSQHEIVQLAGRNVEKLKGLSSYLKTDYTANLNKINTLADIYIISVSDRSIAAVAEQLKLNNKIVVHTAAAVSREVLAKCSDSYGVLYPLQTFRKEIAAIAPIPILVDGNDDQTREKLADFARSWADNVLVANDEERLKLHVAAVFVNNFTNHLFAVAKYFCDANLLNFNYLKPLIKETILRVEHFQPAAVQTGPAVRKDFETIEKHRKILAGNTEVLELYNVLTSSIASFYDRRKDAG